MSIGIYFSGLYMYTKLKVGGAERGDTCFPLKTPSSFIYGSGAGRWRAKAELAKSVF